MSVELSENAATDHLKVRIMMVVMMMKMEVAEMMVKMVMGAEKMTMEAMMMKV